MNHRISAVILLREDGAALLQLRDDKPGLSHANTWVFPGGHCDEGESDEDGGRREFLEETDYDAKFLEYVGEVEYPQFENDIYRLKAFWELYDGKQPLVCREGQDLKFINRKEAESLAIPPFSFPLWDQAIERMKRKFAK